MRQRAHAWLADATETLVATTGLGFVTRAARRQLERDAHNAIDPAGETHLIMPFGPGTLVRRRAVSRRLR